MPFATTARWMTRLLFWDGILPLLIWLCPAIIHELFPRRPGLIEIFAITVPPVACIIRLQVGREVVLRNACGKWTRALQLRSLILSVLVLTLLDTFVVLSHIMPVGALDNPSDRLVTGVMYSVYLVGMAFAIYPARPPMVEAVGDPPREG